ncbi:MAG: flagellar biosynthesis anti-sigma factor FlgM [Bacillota bacterium]
MKIDKFNPHLAQVYTEQAKKQAQRAGEQRERTQEVAISREARELQEYRARLRDLPEVREKLVEELREKVESGTYRPDAKRIAQGIIAEHRLDRRA